MLLPILEGFSASLGLIVAIGAQNAFVIRQGLLCRHLFLTAFTFSLVDALLITFGVLGFGQLITTYPLTIQMAKYFAILFLFIYGAFSFKSAFKSKCLSLENSTDSLKKTICILIALTLLNPHVYLDTVILLGSIASQRPEHEQIHFAIGAISASFIWFFGITYGSRFFAPLFSKPLAWRIIDGSTALIMWGIALSLF